MRSLILVTAARLLLPLMGLFSLFLLLRGHNEPGGGFAGGLVASAGYALYALAHDGPAARHALGVEPRRLIAVGLLVALAAGLLGIFAGRPFLSGLWTAIAFPGGAHLELGSPLLFDLGVYLTVVGVTLTITFTLVEER